MILQGLLCSRGAGDNDDGDSDDDSDDEGEAMDVTEDDCDVKRVARAALDLLNDEQLVLKMVESTTQVFSVTYLKKKMIIT